MKEYKIIGKKYPILVIDNFYTNQEYKEIWHEINGYRLNKNLWDSKLDDSNRAKDATGRVLVRNSRVYLDRLYAPNYRQTSFILTHYKKIMSESLFKVYGKMCPASRNIRDVDIDYTMLSYYEDGDKYEFHKDRATHTALWWTYKKPKAFTGGDVAFKDENVTIECKDNRMVLFPSFYLHASKPVKLKDNKDVCGKYTVSHFFNINI